ncbi:MAG: hypothetical protein IPH00_16905 [Flavobacteriales bacterium]|nr:hypothetical protein [Flavobacteriales bacterium]
MKRRHRLVKVKNVLENVTGTLESDAFEQQELSATEEVSGISQVQQHQGKFLVFYDRPSIQNGLTSGTTYYKSDPFFIDTVWTTSPMKV